KFHETEAVAESEPARDAAHVPADLAGLVDHHVRKPAALENRMGALTPRDGTEEGVMPREDKGQSSDAGALEDLLDGRGIRSRGDAARAHPGRERHRGEDVGGAVNDLEGHIAAERLAGQHDLMIAELLLGADLLYRALDAAGEGASRHRLRE